jgi:phytoene desaturase
VVVGAGLAGLSAALRLAGAGREVTVVERADAPGGRCGLLARDGYAFDTGPAVLTMPGLLADALGAVGEDLDDWLDLVALDPLYLAHFPDGSTLNVRADVGEMAEEIGRVCGAREAAGYRRYVGFVSELYRTEMADFIDRNLDGVGDLFTANLVRIAGLGGFRRLSSKVAQYLHDPRTQRVLSFQSMYAGLSPFDALALYAVISYMDTVGGVFFPRGGMHAVPRALAAAGEKHGVSFRYGTPVERVIVEGGRARGIVTSAGERVSADAVVVTADLPVAYRQLLPAGSAPRRLARQRYSPSCFLLLAGSRARYAGIAHHNLHFGRAWRRTFSELIDRGDLMSDPSLFVTNPSRTDPGLAPPGRESYYVLAPVPNLDAPLDWETLGPRYRDECLARLEGLGYIGFADSLDVVDVTTPADWAARGMERGAPFAAAHTFAQTGPFRARNLPRGIDGLVFAGSGTVPGVGVPMVLVSGRLAAERIVGTGGQSK